VTDILVRQKRISVGRAYSEASLFTQPLPPLEVLDKIRNFCREDIRDRVLTQEILIYLSLLIKSEPALFTNLLTLRVGYLIILLTSDLAQERGVPQDEAYEALMQLAPFDIQTRLRQILMGYDSHNQSLFQQESLHLKTQTAKIDWVVPISVGRSATPGQPQDNPETQDWLRLRQIDGAKGTVPPDFYSSVWQLLNHCKGLVVGDKLERRNRLESEALLSEMTPEETNFALQVEHLLNKIQAPEYRQVNVEALMELAAIAQSNPDLKIQEYIVLDVLVGHAVRLAWLEQYPEHEYTYAEHKATAWRSFYSSSPYDCASFVAKALQFLTLLSQAATVA
jgi:phosphorylase kinase alpha/beta subunit